MRQTRREVLFGIGAAISGALIARRAGAAVSGPSAAALPLAAGTKVGACSVIAVEPVREGAIPVRMTDSQGQTFVVEVMRFDPAAPGVARAGSLAVYLRNGGNGAKATNEEHGLAAMALARVLAAREAAGATVPRLASVRERSAPAR